MALLTLLFSIGCGRDHSPAGSFKTISCTSSAKEHLLRSKLDDDDGDGNPFDEDFPAINDEDDDIADHTWIKDETGLYHLFFHNEGHGSGSAIEHYISTDLESLQYAGIALSPDPGAWDSMALWAPHVVRYENTYYMFYTGVDGFGPESKQRIGLAISNDLMTWTRFPVNRCAGTSGDGCIYECDEPWTTWGDSSGSFNRQCRDPFVIWDPDNQRWIMFATAKSTNEYGVVTAAYSADLVNWTGAGFIDATRRLSTGTGAQATGGQSENPFVMSHRGTHFLLFTDWRDLEDSLDVADPRTITQYATATSLAVDSSGSANWIYRGYIPDPGVNAIEVQRIDRSRWIMSQSISNERSGQWVNRRKLRLKCVIWQGNFSCGTANVEFSTDNMIGAAGPTAARINGN